MNEFLTQNLTPTIWCVAGILLALSEFIVPGFIVIFFGIAAILVGLLLFCVALPPTATILLYIVLSVGLLVVCRRFMPKTFTGDKSHEDGDIDTDDIVGAHAVVREAIRPGRSGSVEFRGSFWHASADEEIPAGADVVIERRDNITLFVRPL